MRSRLAPARLLARSSRRLSTATAIAPLDFTDPRTAFSGTSTAELLRGAVVLTACTIRPFVMNAEMLLGLSTRVFGKTFTDTVVRKTFFAHFVAGESAEGIKPVMQALKAQGVGGILDYAAEADMGDNPLTAGNANQPARVYPYAGEDECDANMQHFLTGVKAVADTSPDGFAAIKVTALGDPKLLERISDSLSAIQGDLPRAVFGPVRHISAHATPVHRLLHLPRQGRQRRPQQGGVHRGVARGVRWRDCRAGGQVL